MITSQLNAKPAPEGWPEGVNEISIRSTADDSEQPAMAYLAPDDGTAKPLLVGLHSWGSNFNKPANGSVYARWAMQEGWNFVYPNFRGPNVKPEAMGSDLAVQDIVDAVKYMQKNGAVDASRIYLVGASGGGHMALLMAGRHPEIWAGVSAWVPISDITAWHAEHSPHGKPASYALKIQKALGGPPDNDERRKEAEKRSPVTWLADAKDVPLDINHGVHDGRKGSVPFRHSLFAFNRVALPQDQLPEKEIMAYYETQQLPVGWAAPEADKLYERNPVLFRKTSGNARITVFEGGHQILYVPALNWLAHQKKGSPVVWEIANPRKIEASSNESAK